MGEAIARRPVIPAPYRVRGKLQRESRVPGGNRDPVLETSSRLASGGRLDSPVSGTGQAYQVRNDCLFDQFLKPLHYPPAFFAGGPDVFLVKREGVE
jgi:hypothetical protein